MNLTSALWAVLLSPGDAYSYAQFERQGSASCGIIIVPSKSINIVGMWVKIFNHQCYEFILGTLSRPMMKS